jgi:small conductance mechanosensitive channel
MDLQNLASESGVDGAAVAAAQALFRVLGVLAVAVVAWWFSRRLTERIEDPRIRAQVLFFVPKTIAVFAIAAAVGAIGIDVSGMAAVMATIGLTGAVVFTPVGQNWVAGAMITIDDVYDIGDVITINDTHGTVVHRSLIRTEIELPDGSKAWIPNSAFQENEVLNHSRLGGWRICVQVPLDRSADRRKAQTIMDRVVDRLEWNQRGKPAFVTFDQVGSEAMFFNAYAWIGDRTHEPYYRGLLLDEMVDNLEQEGISVGQTTNLSIGTFGRRRRRRA